MILEKCPTPDELRALSLGQLNEEQSDEMLGHVQRCNECQSDLETDAGEDTLIKSLRADAADPFAEESDCQVAMAKALGALAASEAFDNSELSQLLPKVLGTMKSFAVSVAAGWATFTWLGIKSWGEKSR